LSFLLRQCRKFTVRVSRLQRRRLLEQDKEVGQLFRPPSCSDESTKIAVVMGVGLGKLR
jgi:hypothetical protein